MQLLEKLFAQTKAIHAARPMVKMEATWLCSSDDFAEVQNDVMGSSSVAINYAVDFQKQHKAKEGNPRIGLFCIKYRGFTINVFETAAASTIVGVLVTGPKFENGATTWMNDEQREIAASVRAGFSSPANSALWYMDSEAYKAFMAFDPFQADELSQQQTVKPLVFDKPKKVYYEGKLPTLPDRLVTMLLEQGVILTPQAVMELPPVETVARQLHADEAVTKHWPPYHDLPAEHRADFVKRATAVMTALIKLGQAKQAEQTCAAVGEMVAYQEYKPGAVIGPGTFTQGFVIGPGNGFFAAHTAMGAAHGVRRPHYPSGAQLIWENSANRYVRVSGPREEWKHSQNRYFVELHPSDVEAMDWEVLPKVDVIPPTV